MRRGEEEGAREKKFKKNAFKHHFSVIIRVRWSNVFDLVFYVCWLNIFKWNRLLVPCLHVLSSHFSLSLSLSAPIRNVPKTRRTTTTTKRCTSKTVWFGYYSRAFQNKFLSNNQQNSFFYSKYSRNKTIQKVGEFFLFVWFHSLQFHFIPSVSPCCSLYRIGV